jgi:low affinity Fe/Cu permease
LYSYTVLNSEDDAMAESKAPQMPSDVDSHVGWFDKFADHAAHLVSRAWFFAFCVLLVVIWAPSIVIIHSISTWQLIINTLTTIITFLLVALLQNTQERSNNAIQAKLNAIADSMSDLMKSQGLDKDAAELRQAVGLEDRESSDGK